MFDASLKPKRKETHNCSVKTAANPTNAVMMDGTLELEAHEEGARTRLVVPWTGPTIYGQFFFPEAGMGIKVLGVLGMDVIGKYGSVSFDFQHHTMTVTEINKGRGRED